MVSIDRQLQVQENGISVYLLVFDTNPSIPSLDSVTCVQFNPVDESRFISGSIDGKVRIWGVHTRRVEDWANVRDIVTAVCYQPNGKVLYHINANTLFLMDFCSPVQELTFGVISWQQGFVVGSISGSCRFYESSSDELVLNAELNIQGKKKSPGNKITGIQVLL